MRSKPGFTIVVALLMLMLASGQLVLADGGKSRYVRNIENKPLSGAEQLPSGVAAASHLGASRSPGTQIGDTYYENQHNGSMGRQIVFTYEGTDDYAGVHMTWTCLPCEGGARHIRYNARDDFTGYWAWEIGPDGGTVVSDDNGEYPSIDVSHSGAAVLSYHNGWDPDFYTAKVAMDHNPPLGYFDPYGEAPGPPTCEGWVTGGYEPFSSYIWPKVEYDECGEDIVFHLVGTESHEAGAPSDEIRTMVYWKSFWDDAGAGQPVFPPCATAIDSVYDISVVVRQDPTSDEVAIVWGRPIHYEEDWDDPCGLRQWQNDVYVWTSTDCGEYWDPGNKINVTDYTQGGTVPIDQVPQLMYTDLSALYDHNGVLHVVWSTPLRDGCIPTNASRIWHWDDGPSGCISMVYDASRPRYMADPGEWNNSTCKMNVSECDDKLYCSFTRFGAYTSANGDTSADASEGGYENGEIFLVASSDGGITWSEAQNLTNTNTYGCEPGECESEHWSTMAKYSSDSVYIEYIEDKDAGSWPLGEGAMTCNPVRFITHECFYPDPYCDIAYTPVEVGYPMHIAPNDGSGDCTSGLTTTFTLRLYNIGNQGTNYMVTSDQTWLTPSGSGGTLNAGCGASVDIEYTIGPMATEGVYDAIITLEYCGDKEATINVRVFVYCYFYVPERELLSTACWSVGVWNNARAGTAQWDDPEGNMYWFYDDVSFMYDESVIITYADDTCQTWFSLFDGSDDDVDLVALSYLTTASFPGYEYAHAEWANGDTNIVGEIEYYLPTHPDTCILIERLTVCNGTEEPITIHIGEAIDWNIPDGSGGSNNQCGYDVERQMLYQFGPEGGPEENYYGGASFCHEIPGGEVSMNDQTVYPNGGYEPCWVGGLLARASTFELAPYDSVEDLNTVYAVAQYLTLDPDSCYLFCKVKTGSMNGLADLQALIDKGKQWIEDHELDCPGCGEIPLDCIPGDANGSGGDAQPDADDIVAILNALCNPPQPLEICADANGDCSIDVYDASYLINCIFSGGPWPVNPGCPDPPVKPDPGDPDSVSMTPNGVTVTTGQPFSIPIYIFNDEGLWQIRFDEFFLEYTRGSGVLSCDSVTYWGTRLETSPPLPIRSFSTSGFGSAEGGYIYLSLESSSSGDTLWHGAGDVVNVWFTGQAAGLAEITYPSTADVLYISLSGYKKRQHYNCFEPILDFGTVEVIELDPVLVATPTGSHSFDILVGESPRNRLEHDFTVTIINDAGLTLCEPLAPPNYPELEVVTAPEEEGRYVCNLPAGGMAPACSAVIKLSGVPVRTVPVRVVDTDGNLYVTPDDFDWGYSDLDGDGDVDNDDFYIFNQYLWQSCTENLCAANTQSIWFTPPEDIEAGDTIDVYMSYKNNMTDPVLLEGVRLFATPYGYGMEEYEYQFINLNSWVAPGVEYVVEIQSFVVPDSGLGCLTFRGTVAECPGDSFHVQTCPNVFVQCDPGEVACFMFKTHLTDDAYVFPYPPSEPYGWGFQVEPEQGYYPSGDSIVLVLCHTAATSALDSIVYTCFLCEQDILNEDCERRDYRAVISATNGDANCDCQVDIDDVVYLIAYIFSGGPEPCVYELGDPDCSYGIDIDDVVYLINYIFSGGDPPKLCI